MRKTNFVLDVETDGPDAYRHSLFWFGLVRLDESPETSFEGRMSPITEEWDEKALAVSGKTREEILTWPDPAIVMPDLVAWVEEHTYPGTISHLWSDNNGYDVRWFLNYLDRFAGQNPFGHSSRNIGDRHRGIAEGAAYAGKPLPKKIRRSFKSLRKTVHDHNPVNDAIGNAEALLALRQFGLQIDVGA